MPRVLQRSSDADAIWLAAVERADRGDRTALLIARSDPNLWPMPFELELRLAKADRDYEMPAEKLNVRMYFEYHRLRKGRLHNQPASVAYAEVAALYSVSEDQARNIITRAETIAAAKATIRRNHGQADFSGDRRRRRPRNAQR